MSLSVKRVEVHDLHGRLDLELDLHPDVNVLYGRNGSGKTTLLHIIANILSGSLDRFIYLQFNDVSVELSDESRISLIKLGDGGSPDNWHISVRLDDREVTRINPLLVRDPSLSSSHEELFLPYYPSTSPSIASKEALIHRRFIREAAKSLPIEGAAYFPAFRTMIEAWRSSGSKAARSRLYIPEPPTI